MRLLWRDVAVAGGPAICTSLTADETAELSRLAAGGEVLEFGSAYGYSTCVLGLVAAHVVAVDPQPDPLPLHLNLAALGLRSRVEVVSERSATVMGWLAAEGSRFDLIFVDGDHRYPAVTADIAGALTLLAPGGVLACHDYREDSCPDVARALDEAFPDGPTRLIDTLFVVDT